MSNSFPEIPVIGLKPSDNHSTAQPVGWLSHFLLPLLLLGLLVGCQPAPTELYRPPTLSIPLYSPSPTSLPATSTPHPLPETPIATAAPVCTNNLTFQEDLTIPDGTLVAPGEVLDKRWQVLNSGTCNWDASYRLLLLSGPDMGAASEQALYPARSGTSVVIRILFTAPLEPGVYQSAWQASDPGGNSFGDPIYIQIIVQSSP